MYLGKRPPIHKPTLGLAQFLRVVDKTEIPMHPPVLTPPTAAWTMDRNDEAGDCVVAGMNHALQSISLSLGLERTPWTDDEILALYQTQNPDFKDWSQGGTDADQGMVVQTFLEECVRRGHILAFGKVDDDDPEVMRAATYLGCGVITGEMLRATHEFAPVWDVDDSPEWGGHCTTTVGYYPGRQFCVSWGQIRPYTDRFAVQHMDEAWFILTKELVERPNFRNNFDLAGFSAAVGALTDGKVEVPALPPVDPAWEGFPFDLLDKWAKHAPKADQRYEREAKTAYRRWRSDQA